MLRTINIIEGTTMSGKTNKIFEDYRENAKTKKCAFLSFEEDLTSRIPPEEINALVGYIPQKIGAYPSLEEFRIKLNEFIIKNNIIHIYIDSIELAFNDIRFDINNFFKFAYSLNASITITIQKQTQGYEQ